MATAITLSNPVSILCGGNAVSTSISSYNKDYSLFMLPPKHQTLMCKTPTWKQKTQQLYSFNGTTIWHTCCLIISSNELSKVK